MEGEDLGIRERERRNEHGYTTESIWGSLNEYIFTIYVCIWFESTDISKCVDVERTSVHAVDSEILN